MDLKKAAKAARVKGIHVAQEFGVGRSTASRWLTGQHPVPSRYVRRLAEMLHIDPIHILPQGAERDGEESERHDGGSTEGVAQESGR